MNQPKNEVVSVSLARDIVFQLYYITNKSGHVGHLGQVLEISKNDIILNNKIPVKPLYNRLDGENQSLGKSSSSFFNGQTRRAKI